MFTLYNLFRKKLLLLIIIYRILLDLLYVNIINPYYEHAGFVNMFNFYNCTYSWIIFFLCSISYVITYNRYLNSIAINFLLFLNLIYFIPTVVLLQHGAVTEMHSFYTFAFFIVSLMCTLGIKKFSICMEKVQLHLNYKYYKICLNLLCYFFIFLIFALSYIYTGFRIISLDLSQIYEYRLEARSYDMNSLIQYIYIWCGIVIPIIFMYSMKKRRYILVLMCFIAELLMFGIDAHKSSLFIFFITVLSYFFNINIKSCDFLPLSLIGVIMICILSGLEYFINGRYWLSAIFINRGLLVPSLLGDYYLDFFSNNMPDYFQSSFLRHLGFVSRYDNIAFMMGELYFGDRDIRCNTGLLGDAYTNFGQWGCVIMPIILAAVIIFFEWSTKQTDLKIVFILYLFYCFTLTNLSILSVLSNGGLLMVSLLLKLISIDLNRS